MTELPPPFPKLFTIDEAAPVARRTPRAMRQLRQKGLGPRVVNIDGRLFIRADDLAQWLQGDDSYPSVTDEP